jgi:HAD superfamily hydrolase (TIGR01509 family)
MSGRQLVIFGCSGVLVDCEPMIARIHARLISSAGHPVDAGELVERFGGLVFRDVLMALEKQSSVPFQAVLIDEAERVIAARLGREARATEGARAAVEAAGDHRCVCTNLPQKLAAEALERAGLADLFRHRVFSAADLSAGRPKPAPDIFLHAAQTLAAEPGDVMVVEDTRPGVVAARAAGMRVIGYTGGSHGYPGHADDLTEAGAETVISRWSDLGPVLAALAAWRDPG